MLLLMVLLLSVLMVVLIAVLMVVLRAVLMPVLMLVLILTSSFEVRPQVVRSLLQFNWEVIFEPPNLGLGFSSRFALQSHLSD